MNFIFSSGLSNAITKPAFKKKKATAPVLFPIIIDIEKWKETETLVRSKGFKHLKRKPLFRKNLSQNLNIKNRQTYDFFGKVPR